MKQLHIAIISALLLVSCIKEPIAPSVTIKPESSNNGAYILCEGLWGMDNSRLDRFDFNTNTPTMDFFSLVNTGQRIGDLANDITIYGKFAYITVTTAKTIEKIEVSTGKSISRLIFSSKAGLRRTKIINDTLGAVTDLYNHCIYLFNSDRMELVAEPIQVGPAPEYLEYNDGYLYVANSGYGDYLAKDLKAGTLSVINTNTKREELNKFVGKNLIEVKMNPAKTKLYAVYINLPSLPDSLGGIVEYDIKTLNELRRWNIKKPKSISFNSKGDTVYFLTPTGISMIELNSQNSVPIEIIKNENSQDIWYCLSFRQNTDELWIGNARNYRINGEIIVYSNILKAIKYRFETGLNPNNIIFF